MRAFATHVFTLLSFAILHPHLPHIAPSLSCYILHLASFIVNTSTKAYYSCGQLNQIPTFDSPRFPSGQPSSTMMYPFPSAQLGALLPYKPKTVTIQPIVAANQVEAVAAKTNQQDPLVTFAQRQARLVGKDGLKDRVKGMNLKLDMSFLTKSSIPSPSVDSIWSVFANDGYESSFTSTECDKAKEIGQDKYELVDKKVVRFAKETECFEVVAGAVEEEESDANSNTDSAVSSECDWVPRTTLLGPSRIFRFDLVPAHVVARPKVPQRDDTWVVVKSKGWMKGGKAKVSVGDVTKVLEVEDEVE